jgi:hypothetical protein
MRRPWSSASGEPEPGAGAPDLDALEPRLLWIWGVARSGSTWLLSMLAHPLKLVDSKIDSADHLGFHVPKTMERPLDVLPTETSFIGNHLVPSAASGRIAPEDGGRMRSRFGLEDRASYFFSDKYADVWEPELRRLILARFNAIVERAAERHPVADPLVALKEVDGGAAAPLIMSLFPRSRLLMLLRDGRDVVDSQLAARAPDGWLAEGGWTSDSERVGFVEDRSAAWVTQMRAIGAAYDAHPPDLRQVVRYEELLADPAAGMRSLVDWLGLARSEHWIERSVAARSFAAIDDRHKGPRKFFRAAQPGSWRENMRPEERSAMNIVMADALGEFGYESG